MDMEKQPLLKPKKEVNYLVQFQELGYLYLNGLNYIGSQVAEVIVNILGRIFCILYLFWSSFGMIILFFTFADNGYTIFSIMYFLLFVVKFHYAMTCGLYFNHGGPGVYSWPRRTTAKTILYIISGIFIVSLEILLVLYSWETIKIMDFTPRHKYKDHDYCMPDDYGWCTIGRN